MAGALGQLVKNVRLREAYGTALQRRVAEEFSLERMRVATERVYSSSTGEMVDK